MMPKPLVVEQGQRREGSGAKACFQVNTAITPLKISSWWEIRHQQVFFLFLSHFKYRFRLHAAIIKFMSHIQNSYSLLEKEKGEIVLYQPDDNVRLERRMER